MNEVADRLAYCGMTGTTLEEYASPDPEPAKPKFSIPARFNGTCGFCFKPTIENVSQITNTEDYGWIHVECFGLDHSDELLVGEICSSCFTQKPLSGICDNCD